MKNTFRQMREIYDILDTLNNTLESRKEDAENTIKYSTDQIANMEDQNGWDFQYHTDRISDAKSTISAIETVQKYLEAYK